MNAVERLRQLATSQSREQLLTIGRVASAVWLVVAGVFAWLGPDDQAGGIAAWLIWTVGVILPLALLWFAIWSINSLTLLRQEADLLRAMLDGMREAPGQPLPQRIDPLPAARPIPERRATTVTPPPRPATAVAAGDVRQAHLEFEAPAMPELTPTELFLALNFPDGPDDREAIRCLRLALGDPNMARLIRAAQDVVTLLAGQGVYMDDLAIAETDAGLWHAFSQGARGASVAGLAVIDDAAALDAAADMMRRDEVFRDVAHHFLRHFDRLLTRRAEIDDAQVLAVLAETRSGRAFILLAQVVGMLGHTPAEVETTKTQATEVESLA